MRTIEDQWVLFYLTTVLKTLKVQDAVVSTAPVSPLLTPDLLLWCSQDRRQDSTTHLGTNSNT